MTFAFVETPAPEPKSEHDHRGNNAAAKRVPRGAMAADKGQFFALAERWLRPADQLDYMIRRWLIHRLIATDSSLRWSHKHSRGASESNHHPANGRNESAEAIRCTVGAARMSKSTPSKIFIHRQPRCSNITGASPMFNAKFAVGDRVEDRDSKRVGTIVHVYKDREIRDELVAVRFDDNSTPLAVHIDDLYKRTSRKPAVLRAIRHSRRPLHRGWPPSASTASPVGGRSTVQ